MASLSPESVAIDPADRAAIIAAALAIANGADRHDWAAVANADEVELDYGKPEHLTPSAIVQRWEPLLEAFDSTDHQISDFVIQISGARATVKSRFVATHTLAGHGSLFATRPAAGASLGCG